MLLLLYQDTNLIADFDMIGGTIPPVDEINIISWCISIDSSLVLA